MLRSWLSYIERADVQFFRSCAWACIFFILLSMVAVDKPQNWVNLHLLCGRGQGKEI